MPGKARPFKWILPHYLLAQKENGNSLLLVEALRTNDQKLFPGTLTIANPTTSPTQQHTVTNSAGPRDLPTGSRNTFQKCS